MSIPGRVLRAAALPLLVALGCAATDDGAAGDPPRPRRLSELPEEHRVVWTAWTERAEDWPAVRARALADESVTLFLVENLTREMVRAFLAGDLSRGHESTAGRYDRARAELLILGAPAVPTVAEVMAIGDGAVAQVCSELLVAIGVEALPYVTGLLDRDERAARERAALVLAELPRDPARDGDAHAALAARLADDDAWTVRVACAGAVAARGARARDTTPARRALAAALGDEDAAVAAAAAAGLGRLGDRRAVPALINHLERCDRRADVNGFQAAGRALRRLTGASGPRFPEEWRAWWREHGAGG